MKTIETRALSPILGVASLAADTIDRDARTVDLIFYSGSPVYRVSWDDGPYELEFEVSKKAANFARLNNGASLIDSHNTYGGVGSILGVVEKAWIDEGQARARVRFSKRADVEPIWQDVLDGVIRSVSMGTYVLAMEEVTEKSAAMKRFRATEWEPYEISLVSVPADAGAKVLQSADAEQRPCLIQFSASAIAEAPNGADAPKESKIMKHHVRLLATGAIVEIDESEFDEKMHSKDLQPAHQAATPMSSDLRAAKRAVEDAIARDQELAAETKRVAAHFNLDAVWAQRQINLGTSIEQVIELASQERAQRAPKTVNDIGFGDDRESASWRAQRMAEALAARAMGRAIPEESRQYAAHRMVDLAHEVLGWHRMNAGLDPRMHGSRIVELALTTSDFPNLLANAANKMLLPEYEAAQPTYRLLAERQDLPDFKTASILKVGDLPVPLQVAEDGEIKLGSFSEAKDTFALATYGRRLNLSFQSIVNDDLGAFNRVMRAVAVRLADFENSLWFNLLTSASGVGPTLGDSVALFNAASHSNYTSSGTAISVDSIGVGRALMRKQTSLDGIKLNVLPRYILTSPEKEQLARQFTTQIQPTQGSNVNPWAGTIEPLADANLVSANPWYLFADPTRAPVSVYGYLQGQAGPSVASRQGFEVLGVEMRVALHFGCAFVDHRGAYRNAGA